MVLFRAKGPGVILRAMENDSMVFIGRVPRSELGGDPGQRGEEGSTEDVTMATGGGMTEGVYRGVGCGASREQSVEPLPFE